MNIRHNVSSKVKLQLSLITQTIFLSSRLIRRPEFLLGYIGGPCRGHGQLKFGQNVFTTHYITVCWLCSSEL